MGQPTHTPTSTHTRFAGWELAVGANPQNRLDKRSANKQVVLKLRSKEPYREFLGEPLGDPLLTTTLLLPVFHAEEPGKISSEQVLWLSRTPGQQVS